MRPIFLHAAQTWPPQRGLSFKADALQRRMTAMALGIFRYPEEPFVSFAKRRSRMAASVIEQNDGWWTKSWFTRAIAWDEHCRRSLAVQLRVLENPADIMRSTTNFPWPPLLLDWKGLVYLRERRTFQARGRGSLSFMSRTSTRAASGHVAIRWHDGVLNARALL